MFGFGKKSKSPPSSKSQAPNSFDFDIPDIPDLPADHEDLGIDAFSDADLNDPDLLAELRGLSLEDDSEDLASAPPVLKKAATPTTARVTHASAAVSSRTFAAVQPRQDRPTPDVDPIQVDVDAVVADIPGEDFEPEVEFTDADLENPVLLAQLRAIAGDSIDIAEDITPERPTPSSQRPPSLGNVQHHHHVQILPPTQPSVPTATLETSTPPPIAPPPFDDTLPLVEKIRSSHLEVLSEYVKLEKSRALTYKKEGDRAAALNSMRASKILQQRYEQVLQASQMGFVPPQVPPEWIAALSAQTPSAPSVPVQPPSPVKPKAEPSDAGSKYVEESKPTASSLSSSSATPANPSTSPALAATSVNPPTNAPTPNPKTPASPSSPAKVATNKLALLTQRQTEYKQQALAFKKINELTKAREMLVVIKSLQQAMEALSMGGELPQGFQMPGPPPTTDATSPLSAVPSAHVGEQKTSTTTTSLQTSSTSSPLQPGSSTTTAAPAPSQALSSTSTTPSNTAQPLRSTVSGNETDIFTHLINKLESQIKLCTTVSAYYYRTNKKDAALEVHKMKKMFQQDVDTLKALKATSGAAGASANNKVPVPGFRYTTFTYEVEEQFSDIPLDEMEVSVVRAWDLGGVGSGGGGSGARTAGAGVRGSRTFGPAAAAGLNPGDIESFVQFDIGWPPADDRAGNGASSPEAYGETPVVKKDPNPEYNYIKRFKIARTKAFQRYLERRKMTFTVNHLNASSGGGIAGALASFIGGVVGGGKSTVPLGKATLKVDGLVGACEVHEVLELTDPSNPRRSVPGRLEVVVRLRVPLLKPHILKKTEERWLMVDFGGDGGAASGVASSGLVSAPVSLPPQQPQQQQQQQQKTPSPMRAQAPAAAVTSSATAPTGSAAPPLAASSASSSATPSTGRKEGGPAAAGSKSGKQQQTQPAATGPTGGEAVDVEELEMSFLSPDNIVSNRVLEVEHAALSAKLATPGGAGDADARMELIDRKQGYDIRMNLLVTMVQIGSLTMEDYVAQLKKSISETRTTALTFKRAGRVDLAKQALTRIKLMQEELESVEQEMG
ncbi:Coiled-coil and C2 domain-containing protein 1A [Quaeritorhiza haematococci]|nr:Coiled-coil and C2 domain-containing protein 1A [Quaeritorhiza haematococci]